MAGRLDIPVVVGRITTAVEVVMLGLLEGRTAVEVVMLSLLDGCATVEVAAKKQLLRTQGDVYTELTSHFEHTPMESMA